MWSEVALMARGNPERPVAVRRAAFVRISTRPIPRVLRMMRVSEECGYQPIFVGAKREPGLSDTDVWEGAAVRRVGVTFPLLNGTRPHVYAAAISAFNVGVFRALKNLRPAVVHCSDIEPFGACWLYCRLYSAHLIYNIHDNLSQRYSLPGPVQWMLNCAEGGAVVSSDVTLVPEEFRRLALPRWSSSRVQVLRNTPADPGRGTVPTGGADHITVFFGGWLDWGRGLQQLIDLAAADPRIRVRIAGEGRADIIDAVRRQVRVEYVGYLSHDQILRESKEADFIAALYDPSRIINRYAASNKIAEALAVGRPVIVNSELAIAEYLRDRQCSVQIPYGELATSGDRLWRLRNNIGAYAGLCEAARNAYDVDYSWEQTVQHIARSAFPAAVEVVRSR
jgi:glycosyltransferase involved in cell wall biosynthesis